MECAIHRRYKAMRKPRVLCERCWFMWVAAQTAREKTAQRLAQEAYDRTPQGQIDKRNREYDPRQDPSSCWYG
jgi:hypothetical protein